MKILLIGYGSRGDVQPLLALGQGLVNAGYDITIAAGNNFQEFVENAGLKFVGFATNMQQLMTSDEGKEWIDNSSGNSLREAQNMKRMLELVSDSVEGDLLSQVSEDVDVIVSGLPLFMSAHAIAEKFDKKHITIQLVPLNPTKEGRATIQPTFPQKQIWVNRISGYIGQYFTYWIFKSASNNFRQRLGLAPMSYSDYARAYNREVPVIYALSKHVITEPDDWRDNTHVTGYWFYDDPSDWQPSQALCDFLDAGEKPIYIGFGSMSNKNPEATTSIMVEALQKAGKRGIIYSGWAGLNADALPDDVFLLDFAPHDWLFPKMAGVVHHGGAGTTAAGIRAGVPATVVSHMADQPYWGRRVHELGIGAPFIRRHKLTSERLAEAIRYMTDDPAIAENAQNLSRKIEAEDGVAEAVKVFQRLLA